jgi:dipeptidyl-peptidase-2
MRFRYPNIIAGSIAASAPILVVAGQSSRDDFFRDVTQDFKNAVPKCDTSVRDAFSTIAHLATTGDAGYKTLTDTFKLCSQLKSLQDYRHLIGWMRNAFTVLAMMDYPYPTDFIAPLPANPVKVACQKIMSAQSTVVGMSSIMDMVYRLTGSTKCHNIDSEYVECADPTGCGTGLGSFPWDYQVCTEFIMPAGSNNETDMFPPLSFTLEQRDDYCMKRWKIKPQNDWPAISFWGKDITSATNIVFSNGNLDPWCHGGILKNVSESVVAIMIEGGAHHLDLRSSNPADPPSVTKARQVEIDNIRKWIAESRTKNAT